MCERLSKASQRDVCRRDILDVSILDGLGLTRGVEQEDGR